MSTAMSGSPARLPGPRPAGRGSASSWSAPAAPTCWASAPANRTASAASATPMACWSWSCTRPATGGGSCPRTGPCSTGAARSPATEAVIPRRAADGQDQFPWLDHPWGVAAASCPRRPRQGWSGKGRHHRGEGPLDGSERGGVDPAFYASGLLVALTGVRSPQRRLGPSSSATASTGVGRTNTVRPDPAARAACCPPQVSTCCPADTGSGWVGSSDHLGAFWDLDRAVPLVAVLVQDRHGVLVHHDVHRSAVGGQHRVAVTVDEVLPSQHPLLGWPVQREPEASRTPGAPPAGIVAEGVGARSRVSSEPNP